MKRKLLQAERPLSAGGGAVYDSSPRKSPFALCKDPQNAQAITGLPDLLDGALEMVKNVSTLLREETLLSLPTLTATAKLAAGIARALDRPHLRELERFEGCGSLSGALRKEAIALILTVERLLREGGL